MTAALLAGVGGLVVGVVGALAWELVRRRRALRERDRAHRIAFPFTGHGLAEPALRAALRIARAEQATLVPVYLAIVPRQLDFDVPLPAECDIGMGLLEAIEHRAARAEIAVDARIERGRSVRHALSELMEHERFDRIVVAASADGSGDGFAIDDLTWLLERAPAEILVLRPALAGELEPELTQRRVRRIAIARARRARRARARRAAR